MIRFLKEVYLTGFVLCYRSSRSKRVQTKVGGAIGVLMFIQACFLMGINFSVDIYLHKQITSSSLTPIIILAVLFCVNEYLLNIPCGYGIKFEREFDSLNKSRRKILIIAFIVISIAALAFGVFTGTDHLRLIDAGTILIHSK